MDKTARAGSGGLADRNGQLIHQAVNVQLFMSGTAKGAVVLASTLYSCTRRVG